jgi:endoglucanase
VRWAGARADVLLGPVSEVVEAAWARGLAVVVTDHHDDEAMADPQGAAGRLAELWRGIATHFLGFRGQLAFELLNEPLMNAADWNDLLPGVLAAVRAVDPERLVVVGGADASSVAGLRQLELPEDERLVATVHYYEPCG